MESSSRNIKRHAESNGHRRKLIRKSVVSPDKYGQQSLDSTVERPCDICGMIKRIILKNILCHEYLDVDIFTPNINLLQGKNGSGKSSIVAAVIAGLGGNLRSTDRGSSIKSLIKSGTSCASIVIHLKNSGSLAYKHDQYGDEVIVERRIPASGSATYKIKSVDGTTISTKKEDLTRILDWYNFQVENPLLILSQERAKSFLSSTDPRELFKFFMTATFLQQLKEDIHTISSNLDSTNNLIQSKVESLSSLEKDVKDWEQKVQTINTLEDKRKQVASFRHEKAWAEIRDLEEKIEEKEKKVIDDESIVERIQKTLQNSTLKKKNLETDRKKIDEELVKLAANSEENERKRRNMSEELKTVKAQCRTEMSKKNTVEREILDIKKDINILKKKLEKDDDEAKNLWAISNEKLMSKRNELENELSKLQEICQTEEVHWNHLQTNHTEEQDNYNQYKLEENGISSRLNGLWKELDSLRKNNNSLSIFGPYMPKLLAEIEIASERNAFQSKPIGPLGRHIKIKDQKWAHIAELVISNLMTSFIVTNNDDLHKLQRIFRKELPKERIPNIICSSLRNQVHDFKKYEVISENYTSLWSLLEIDNIHVANTLLDQLNVESTLLIPTGPEAANILKDYRSVPRNCKRAYTLHGDIYFPDPNFKVYSGMGDKSVRFFQVSVEDKISDLELNINCTTQALEEMKQDVQQSRTKLYELKKEIDLSKKKKQELEKKKFKIIQSQQELLNQETPPPPDVIQLQEELKDREAQYTISLEKVAQIKIKLTELKSILRDKENLHDDSLKEGESIQEQSVKFQNDLDTLSNKLLLAKREIATDSKKLQIMKEHIDLTKASVKELEEKLKSKMKIVSTIHSERIVTKRSIKDIEKNLLTLERAIEGAEETVGDPMTVVAKYKEKAKRYESTKSEITSQQGLIAIYKRSMPHRKKLFNFNKKLSGLLLSSSFKTHIQKRDLEGLITVNYEDETIEILMKKDCGRKDPANRDKGLQSLKMMSGGERSFATVSYIISLWQLIFSPVRIMDEFDIFMDVVSKKQCIDMIVEAVEANNTNTQYILVSPQEYNKNSPILSVFRMPDPERSLNRVNEMEED